MSKIQTVYDHIRTNNIKTVLLVALFPLTFIALIFLFTYIGTKNIDQAFNTTLTVAIPTIIICLIWMLISWAFGDSMILNVANAHEITADSPENKKIINHVENIALAAGLPTPRVYIIEDNSLNAFATGRTPHDASIALTRGIINKLDDIELSGVIAHEMAHIGNRDIRLDMLLITGVGVTVFIADLLARTMYYNIPTNSSDDKNNNNTGIILLAVWLAFVVFNAIISPLLQMAVSRNREYAADSTGAFITRNPHALASALKKISTDSHIASISKMKTMAAICIASPAKAHAFLGNMLSTHPPVKKRIERLESINIKN